MRCPRCGSENDDGMRFCTNCGTDLMVTETAYIPHKNNQPKKSSIIICALAIALVAVSLVALMLFMRPWESSVKESDSPSSTTGASQTGLVNTSEAVLSFSGGSSTGGSTSPITGKEGEDVILPKCGYVRDGYEFAKWVDNTGAEYDPGDTLTLTKDLTLTATWVSVATEEPQSADSGNSSPQTTTTTAEVPTPTPTATETPAASTPASSFPRKWSGTYIGTSSYVGGDGHISRAVAFVFSTVTDTGYLEGVCYVGADETGPGATYGTCYVSGNVDWNSGTIHFQGTSWIDQGGLGDLREYSGTVDFSSASMGGSAWDVGTGLYETPWNVHAVDEISIWQNGNLTTVS